MATVPDATTIYGLIGFSAAVGGWAGKTITANRRNKLAEHKDQRTEKLDTAAQVWLFANQTIDRQSKMIDALQADKQRLEAQVDHLSSELIDMRVQLSSAQEAITELQRKRTKNA